MKVPPINMLAVEQLYVEALANFAPPRAEWAKLGLLENVKYVPPVPLDIIVADPAWKFETYSDKGLSRSAENHYACSTIEEMAKIPVAALGHRNTVLFLWVTDPFIPQAIELADAWGFRYSSRFINWVKDKRDRPGELHSGTGYFTRANPEDLFVFRRKNTNKLLTRVDKGVNRVLEDGSTANAYFDNEDAINWLQMWDEQYLRETVYRHSQKPETAQDRIERVFGRTVFDEEIGLTRPLYMGELFARRRRPGWLCLGLELDALCHTVSIPLYLTGRYPVPDSFRWHSTRQEKAA